MRKEWRLQTRMTFVLAICAIISGCIPSLRLPVISTPDMTEKMPAPFELDNAKRAELERVLSKRHRLTAHIEAFACKFTIYEYDRIFGPRDRPISTRHGVFERMSSGRMLVEISGKKTEIYEWDGNSRLIMDRPGKEALVMNCATDDEGMRFSELAGPGAIGALLGSDPETANARFYIRVSTPASAEGQVWLEAFPKSKSDAKWFNRVEVILNAKDMFPLGFRIYGHSEHRWTTFAIEDIVVEQNQ